MRLWLLPVVVLCVGVSLGGCSKPAPKPPTQVEVSQFHDALRDGDETIVDRLLAARPVLANARNEAGETPLAVAQRSGNEELVAVLKRHGAHE